LLLLLLMMMLLWPLLLSLVGDRVKGETDAASTFSVCLFPY
jgi:hypothetical protein